MKLILNVSSTRFLAFTYCEMIVLIVMYFIYGCGNLLEAFVLHGLVIRHWLNKNNDSNKNDNSNSSNTDKV